MIKSLKVSLVLSIIVFLLDTNTFSQDPNFYIYLCFGQSNMEGQGTIEQQDLTVDSRFQVMEATNCTNLERTKGNWYPAVPPLCRCYTGLSPVDYFGRTMVENLPDSIRIGVVHVAVAGSKIELFQKDAYQNYITSVTEDWLKNIINAYNGNPYGYMVGLAKLAQQDGVIKGILLHQGESNTGDSQWPLKVKDVYDNLINDLDLNPDSVPLLAGEVVNADQSGVCASMNSIIDTLPRTIPNSYVIASSGCTAGSDNLHFNSVGYRKLGIRYAIKMLSLYGYVVEEPEDSTSSEGAMALYFEPECATIGSNWDIIADPEASEGKYLTVKNGVQSLNQATTGINDIIVVPFSVDTAGTFNIYARINCPGYDDDSFWIEMDNGGFEMINGVVTSGWQWIVLKSYQITKGSHTLTFTYREDGAKLDKICVSNYAVPPIGIGDVAENTCVTSGINLIENPACFSLGQNYPNPFTCKTYISFEIPQQEYVSLKVYSLFGEEIAELAGNNFNKGEHQLEFCVDNISKGIYYYTIKTENYMSSKKMFLQNE